MSLCTMEIIYNIRAITDLLHDEKIQVAYYQNLITHTSSMNSPNKFKLKSNSNQVYCHILQEEVYMSLTIYSLWQQHIKQ